jgi:hypothetical protein
LTKKNKGNVVDAATHAEEEPVREFETKLNKYGFIHIPKRALPALPFKLETSLTAHIEAESLVISKA